MRSRWNSSVRSGGSPSPVARKASSGDRFVLQYDDHPCVKSGKPASARGATPGISPTRHGPTSPLHFSEAKLRKPGKTERVISKTTRARNAVYTGATRTARRRTQQLG